MPAEAVEYYYEFEIARAPSVIVTPIADPDDEEPITLYSESVTLTRRESGTEI
jgi:hypothetical protein